MVSSVSLPAPFALLCTSITGELVDDESSQISLFCFIGYRIFCGLWVFLLLSFIIKFSVFDKTTGSFRIWYLLCFSVFTVWFPVSLLQASAITRERLRRDFGFPLEAFTASAVWTICAGKLSPKSSIYCYSKDNCCEIS